MAATVEHVVTKVPASAVVGGMAGNKKKGEKKPETKPVRLHLDVAEMAEQFAGVFKMKVPDYLSGLLRPILEEERERAASRILKQNSPPANGGCRGRKKSAE